MCVEMEEREEEGWGCLTEYYFRVKSSTCVAYRDGVSVSSEGVQVSACLHIPDINDPIMATTDLVHSYHADDL